MPCRPKLHRVSGGLLAAGSNAAAAKAVMRLASECACMCRGGGGWVSARKQCSAGAPLQSVCAWRRRNGNTHAVHHLVSSFSTLVVGHLKHVGWCSGVDKRPPAACCSMRLMGRAGRRRSHLHHTLLASSHLLSHAPAQEEAHLGNSTCRAASRRLVCAAFSLGAWDGCVGGPLGWGTALLDAVSDLRLAGRSTLGRMWREGSRPVQKTDSSSVSCCSEKPYMIMDTTESL